MIAICDNCGKRRKVKYKVIRGEVKKLCGECQYALREWDIHGTMTEREEWKKVMKQFSNPEERY